MVTLASFLGLISNPASSNVDDAHLKKIVQCSKEQVFSLIALTDDYHNMLQSAINLSQRFDELRLYDHLQLWFDESVQLRKELKNYLTLLHKSSRSEFLRYDMGEGDREDMIAKFFYYHVMHDKIERKFYKIKEIISRLSTQVKPTRSD